MRSCGNPLPPRTAHYLSTAIGAIQHSQFIYLLLYSILLLFATLVVSCGSRVLSSRISSAFSLPSALAANTGPANLSSCAGLPTDT